MFAFLFLLFLIVPVVEIYVLIRVGQWLGALPTVSLVLLTAVIGVGLLRHQGFSALRRISAALERGEIPAGAIVEGAILLVSAVLLLTPGFVTDAVGFLGLIPVVRRGLILWFIHHAQRPAESRRRAAARARRILDGEFRRVDDD